MASRESLRGANLIRADLAEISMPGVDLTGANLRMVDFTRADLTEARLTKAHLSGALLKDALFVGANLVEASMIGVSLQGADLSRADVSGADLTGANLEHARLVGTYLVGAFLNETCLNGADLSSAYVRMAKLGGSNMTAVLLDGADLSQADLSGVHMEASSLRGAKLVGTSLCGSYLTACDLRDADLKGADLSGCNLTGAKLHGIKFDGAKLDDAWAEWVDLSEDGSGNHRATLEEAFSEIIGRPMAEILIEGQVSEDAWAELITHLCEFQSTRHVPAHVRLRAIQQGVTTAVLYLEGDTELTIAAYLAEFARIAGKGSEELVERLQATIPGFHPVSEESLTARAVPEVDNDLDTDPLQLFADVAPPGPKHYPDNGLAFGRGAAALEGARAAEGGSNGRHADGRASNRVQVLRGAGFWAFEKGFAIITGDRRIWLEAVSNDLLTLRPPHGVISGIDLVRGRFIAGNSGRT
jgi:uncharacterized protein YjbI with pentapeptide repeats